MKIDLKKYLEDRDNSKLAHKEDGVTVTISREFGCNANRIARLLAKHINENTKNSKLLWKIISKEVLVDSAKLLRLKSDDIDRRILTHESDIINQLFNSLSHHYSISDKKIMEQVRQVILDYARKGNVIIVGRGGSMVTSKMSRVLRVRLIAPIEWRTRQIAASKGITYKDAVEVVKHFDENRTRWMEHLTEEKFDQSVFDVIINVKAFEDKQIVQMILLLMNQKGLIQSSESLSHGMELDTSGLSYN